MIETAPSAYHPITHRQQKNGHNSQQPRFSQVSPQSFFNSLFRFTQTDIQDEPEYGNHERDAWLRRVWPLEPYLAGVINSVTNIDKNRGWTITGGRNQVRRFVDILHNRYFFAPDLSGWRMSFGGGALAYYSADLGSPVEIGRQSSENGPLDSLYFIDPVQCILTGNFDFPLRYTPGGQGSAQNWRRDDYFRVVSMPNTDESLFGLGYCAVSRCIELAKIMIGIYQYDNEMLLNQAPRGLLLLKGITQEMWDTAMEARKAKLEGDKLLYYGAVNVLATIDPGVEIEAQLINLSSLPAEFDQRTFTDLLMFGYALCFGYDPREFWPVSAGALGTATETEAQHKKAGAKGGLDYTLGYAEKLQEELPDTTQFEFEERDLDGELANAVVEEAQAKIVEGLYESGLREGASLVSREEARILLAERNLIDPEWTENEEETTATDTDDDVGRALANERVQKAIWKYPDEPIVRYKFSVRNGREQHEYKTLLKPRMRPRSFLVARSFVKRQIEDELELYQARLDELGQQAADGEISQSEFEEELEALTVAILILALLRGIEGTSEAEELLIDAALLILENDSPEARETGLIVLTDQEILDEALDEEAQAELEEEIAVALTSTLAADIYAGVYDENAQGLLSRLAMWGITAFGLFNLGKIIGRPDQRFRWIWDPAKEHCEDCTRLNGQIHTGSEWRRSGWRPQRSNLACTGHHCGCDFIPTSVAVSGGF